MSELSVTKITNVVDIQGVYFSSVNVALAQANSAVATSNTAYTQANTAYAVANTSSNAAIAAFNKANTALQNGAGTFAGTLTVTGDIIAASANLTTINVANVVIPAGGLSVGGSALSGSGSFKIQAFTSNTSWTIPAGVTSAKVAVAGGGGGGGSGGSNGQQLGTAGGNGGFAYALVTGMIPGSTVTITVGGAGTGSTYGGTNYGSSPQQNGTGGKTSSFGSYITCTGGAAGTYGGAGGAAGTATLANSNVTSMSTYMAGSSSFVGSKGTSAGGGVGGSGSAATGYGFGGGGGDVNSGYYIGQYPGGNGSAGLVFIEWIG